MNPLGRCAAEGVGLGDDPLVETAQPEPREDFQGCEGARVHSKPGHVTELWRQRPAQPLGNIDQWIDEHANLQPTDSAHALPRVVDATQEGPRA